MGFHIVLENGAGCELDGRFAKTDDDIKSAVQALVDDCELAEGDVIRIVETTDKKAKSY
jgi:hypothetical protein